MGYHLGRKLTLILIFFLVSSVFSVSTIRQVKAYSYEIAIEWGAEEGDNAFNGVKDEHPSDTVYSSAEGFNFTTGSAFTLGYSQFRLMKVASPTSYLVCAVYAMSGGFPTGNALVYSDLVDSSGLGATAWVTFNFSSSDYELSSSTDYAMLVEVNTTNVDTTNFFRFYFTSNTTSSYGRLRYANSMWSAPSTAYDGEFKVYKIVVEGQDLSFNLFQDVNICSSLAKTMELAKTRFEEVNVFSSVTMGFEKGFLLSSSLNFFSSLSRGLEFQRVLFDAVRVLSSIYKGTELGVSLNGLVKTFSSISHSKEIGRIFFEEVNLFSLLASNIELSVLDLVITLFESSKTYSALGIGRELSRSLFGNIQIVDSLLSSFEGIGQQLTFTLFENVRAWAEIVEVISAPYVLNDALLLAGFAVILAFVAIGLVFLVRNES